MSGQKDEDKKTLLEDNDSKHVENSFDEENENYCCTCTNFFRFTATATKYFGTALEVVPALYVFDITTKAVAKIAINNYILNFIIRHSLPPLAATAVFVALGSLFLNIGKYVATLTDASKASLCDFKDFVIKNTKSTAIFAGKLLTVGTTAFGMFGAFSEKLSDWGVNKSFTGWDKLPAGFIAGAIGVIVFALGNKGINLGTTPEKLLDIIGVFLGVPTGEFAAGKVVDSTKEALAAKGIPALTSMLGNPYRLYQSFWSSGEKTKLVTVEPETPTIQTTKNYGSNTRYILGYGTK